MGVFPRIMLKRVNTDSIPFSNNKYFDFDDEDGNPYDLVLAKGEPLIVFETKYKGKWYSIFMNQTRIKIGNGSTRYRKLPYLNGIFKPGFILALQCISIPIIYFIGYYILYLATH